MKTDDLIAALGENVEPVRPLASPVRRLFLWLVVSAAAIAVVVAVMGLRADLAAKLAQPTFTIQLMSSLATAVTAAIAALSASVPGEKSWKTWLPAVPMTAWLISLGHQCWMEWVRLSPGMGMEFRPDFVCIPAIAMVGVAPALAMVTLLRRGAPASPRLTVALGVLAAGALADFGLRLFHTVDSGLMVLVWQIGSVALFTSLAGLQGHRLLPAGLAGWRLDRA